MTTTPDLKHTVDYAKKALQDMANNTAKSVRLPFDDLAVTDVPSEPNLVISSAIDYGIESAKLIFHVKHISQRGTEKMSDGMKDFCIRVIHNLPGNVHVSVSDSPVFRNQWDVLLWGVPLLRAKEIQTALIQVLLKSVKTPA